jgi:hypothetical protein
MIDHAMGNSQMNSQRRERHRLKESRPPSAALIVAGPSPDRKTGWD